MLISASCAKRAESRQDSLESLESLDWRAVEIAGRACGRWVGP
jgi:hypothetical protein